MLTLVLLIGFLVWSLYVTHQLVKLKKHDEVLYRFCQLRRDVMLYLRENFDRLTREDYERAREILVDLDDTIHFYDEHKITRFNLRPFVVFFIDKIKRSDLPERGAVSPQSPLALVAKKKGEALSEAFFRYTPWLRSELLARVIFHVVARIGTQALKNFFADAEECSATARRLCHG